MKKNYAVAVRNKKLGIFGRCYEDRFYTHEEAQVLADSSTKNHKSMHGADSGYDFIVVYMGDDSER